MNLSFFRLFLALTALALSAVAAAPKPQIRALWVDGFHAGIRTPEEVEKLVADARAAQFNLLIVQVRRRGDSYYTKSLEPPVEDPLYQPDFDALAYLLEKAHAAGLKVHAWMNVTPLWRPKVPPPKDPRHIFNLHGSSAAGTSRLAPFAATAATGRDNWLMSSPTGDVEFPTGYSLDPGHPDAARHIEETILNVVKNYPVDGIHLDYVRYAETNGATLENGAPVGYNAVSLERFRKRHGVESVPAPNDPRWSDWRREQVTLLVRRIYLGIQEINPNVELSAALIPWSDGPSAPAEWPRAHPYWRIFQDWQGWLRAGLLDLAVPMNYDRESDPKTRLYFDHWIEFEKNNKHGRRLAVGIGAYLNTAEQNLAQLRRALARSRKRKYVDGFSIYSYGNNGGVMGKLAETFGPAPPYPPKSAPATGHLAGVLPGADGATVEVSRRGVFGWSRPLRALTDGNGFYGAVHLKPGRYRVRAGERTLMVTIQPGKLTRADF